MAENKTKPTDANVDPRSRMADRRRNREDPPAVVRFGWRYQHLGIPHSSPRDGKLH